MGIVVVFLSVCGPKPLRFVDTHSVSAVQHCCSSYCIFAFKHNGVFCMGWSFQVLSANGLHN